MTPVSFGITVQGISDGTLEPETNGLSDSGLLGTSERNGLNESFLTGRSAVGESVF